MRYEKPPPRLKFYKEFFSSQWKFLIHTLLQCLSAKRTTWNEFSSAMASAVICLATDNQLDDMTSHKTKYTSHALSQKVFANMMRVGKGFSRNETPLFATMLVQPQPEADKGIEMPVAEEQPSTTNRTAQALEIVKLKRRVKKLERRKKSRTLGLQRLRKRRMIVVMDADAEISFVDETKGRNDENDDNLMFDVGALDDDKVLVKTAEVVVDETVGEVSVDEPAVTTVSTPVTTTGATIFAAEPIITTTIDFSEVDMTLAKALVKLKTSKPKVVTTAVVLTTATTVDEEERLRKEREDEASMAAIAELYDEVQAQMDAGHELATRMTHEEQEKYTVEERFTHAQLKSKGFEEIQKLYTKEKDWIDAFVPIGSEEDARRDGSRKKRAAGSSTKQMSPKKQKENDQESKDSDKELRECLKVVPNDDKAIDYETLDVKSLIVDYESQLLTIIKAVLDRPDVLDLQKVVMERFPVNNLEGYDLILWRDLKTLVKPNEDDEI
nr:hypothetical protein [Tanacetum cinerariifolium]